MERRNFLSLMGAAAAAPLLPTVTPSAAAAAGYNRYMYGLAVFHARTRASLTTADLVSKLKVSAATAEAMIGEMSVKGVLAPALNGAGAMRAVNPHGQTKRSLEKVVRKMAETMLDPEEDNPGDQAPPVTPA